MEEIKPIAEIGGKGKTPLKKNPKKFNLRGLRLSLKYRPDILKLVLKMRHCIRKRQSLITRLKNRLKIPHPNTEYKDSYTQTDSDNKNNLNGEIMMKPDVQKESSTNTIDIKSVPDSDKPEDSKEKAGWNINESDEKTKSIADQVKEAAQSALQQTGMVYVESAGMYYDYKTGYYYNSELRLYYHTDTECYYYYSEEKQNFVFHSYPDRRAMPENTALKNHEKKKAKKHKKDLKTEDNIDNLTKSLSQVSLRGQAALEAVAKHHPPCMRVIVKETNLPKLKVGSLYLVTKDGGTIGREGDQHAILIRDTNVSRNHLDIRYDLALRSYVIMDLGSKNGTILNGTRMSESQVVSKPMEVLHGSIIQLGETKLLCHIHPGKDTCGHCEPGLLMEMQEKEKVAYTRTCSVQKQHQLELARLKNKYAPQPLAIEATAYNDRAQKRRVEVGSSHHAEKTQSADIDTFIEPENKGFKLLEKMGWSKGEGLGKDNQGDTEPIPLVSNEGKSGLGASGDAPRPAPSGKLGPATMRLLNKTKMLRPPAKAFQNEDDELESE